MDLSMVLFADIQSWLEYNDFTFEIQQHNVN
jgi:hypothetical protein